MNATKFGEKPGMACVNGTREVSSIALCEATSGGVPARFLTDQQLDEVADGCGSALETRLFPVKLLYALEDHLGYRELQVGETARFFGKALRIVVPGPSRCAFSA